MNILGIDCSTRWTNIGLAVDGMIVGDINMSIGRRQSSLLPSLVTQILSNSGFALDSVDAVSVTSGPGYFTGIRVGLSYGCALAEGIGRKVVIVDSLSALAAPFLNGKRVVVPVIRAGRGFAFSSVIKGSLSEVIGVSPPNSFPVGELFNLDRMGSEYFMVLDDEQELIDEIPELENLNHAVSSIKGGYVALLGSLMFEKAVLPASARGLYLRDPDIGRKKYSE